MSQVQVHVAFGGTDVHAGTLFTHRRRGTESATFTYVTSYLAAPGAYALDPELPLAAGARQTRVGSALFGAMTDSAPDRWGRTLVIRRESALARAGGRVPRSLGEIDFLVGVRDDLRQGALRFRTDHGRFLADDDTGVRQVAAAVSGWRSTAGRHQLTPSEIVAMEPAFAGLADAADV